VGEHFVLNDGGVLEEVDLLDCESGYFGEKDTAEGIGDGGVNANERESEVEVGVLGFNVGS
jgi:hypothetical protein